MICGDTWEGTLQKIILPSSLYILLMFQGTYLYTEGDGQVPGDKARIESFPNDPTDGSCVEFYYYMKGSGVGTLNVFI